MRIVESRSRTCARAAAFVMIAAGVAGCSADATRFRDGPGPMAARPAPTREMTGSVPTGRVDAQPLPPPNRPLISSTGAHPQAAAPVHAPATRVAANTPPPVTAKTTSGGVHVVARGENLASIARRYGKSSGEIAKANHIGTDAKLRIGQRITIPGSTTTPPVKTATASPAQPPAKAAPAPAAKAAPAPAPAQAQAPTPPAPQPKKVASAEPTATARLATPATDTPAAAAEPASTTPTFRWPVRGRVIGSFGAKVNGQTNDGINVSVPEGTSVKAAEDGVVAYSGNELKGYGNLVLVRHAGGYVTAYAHASEVMVKRGDTVKRGQIIARAGQTGSVSSPQLHFEIRKGSSPIDPLQHLSGSDVASETISTVATSRR
jgi:murein DD-endopeptidase MepM/ murein hydrolase activator NlpD